MNKVSQQAPAQESLNSQAHYHHAQLQAIGVAIIYDKGTQAAKIDVVMHF